MVQKLHFMHPGRQNPFNYQQSYHHYMVGLLGLTAVLCAISTSMHLNISVRMETRPHGHVNFITVPVGLFFIELQHMPFSAFRSV